MKSKHNVCVTAGCFKGECRLCLISSRIRFSLSLCLVASNRNYTKSDICVLDVRKLPPSKS